MSTGRRGGWWRGMGERVYGLALLVLPRALRRKAGGAMAATFRARQEERLRGAGPRGLPSLWVRELGGLLVTALRARLPDRATAGPPPGRTSGPASSSLDRLVQDVRFALRVFARRPLPMGLAVVTFGLGVGTSTAMVSVVDALLVRGLPYPEPGRLVSVYPTLPAWRDDPELGTLWQRGRFSPVEFFELEREQEGAFEALGAVLSERLTLTGGVAAPEVVQGFAVSPGTLTTLGISPALGRAFTEDDLRADPPPVLLSHGLWMRRFGGDPGAVGDVLRSGERAFPVVGVLPVGSRMPWGTTDYLSPLDVSANPSRNLHDTRAIGRLAPGVGLDRAQEEASAILLRNVPDAAHQQHTAFLVPLQDDLARGARTPALVLMGASLLLLAVACGSVAAILLGVGLDREAELGVRRALGAGHGRVVAQLLTEGLVLALGGGLVGLGVATWTVDLLVGLAPEGFPGIEAVGLDARTTLVALGLSTAAALVAALGPAVALVRRPVGDALRAVRTATPGAGRLQTGLVVGELALATVLLVGSGLLVRTLRNLDAADPGFETERVVAVSTSASLLLDGLLARDRTRAFEELRLYVEEVVDALAGLPGVEGAAAVSPLPLGGGRADNRLAPADREVPEEERPVAARRAVTVRFFETAGIELLEGRGFTREDARTGDSVTVLSEGLARALWPAGSPVGRSVLWGTGTYRVVGVAGNVRDREPRSPTELAFYVPTGVTGSIPTDYLVRTAGDPRPLIPAIRERIWSVDPDVPLLSVRTLAEHRRDTVSEERYRARLMLVFAILAVLFALTGVYGVVSRAVARRRREMGLRIALGAARSGIHALVLRQSLWIGLSGTALGLLLAVLAGRTVERFLYGVEPGDPATLLAIALLVLGAVTAASLGPSLKATRVDPAETLRAE